MRKFIKLIGVLSCYALLSQTVNAENTKTKIVCPTKIQQEWADAEIGILVHPVMEVFRPNYNWREWGSEPSPSVFNPTKLSTDQWMEAAQKIGAKYFVLVAKHGSGFSLWPTEAHPYSIKNSVWRNGKGDIVKDFINSCKKYGVKPGVYCSTSANGYLRVENPGIVQPGSSVTQQQYNEICKKQLTELWTNYGPWFEIWFDGGIVTPDKGGPNLFPLLRKYQPNAIVFQGPYDFSNLIRWVGNEKGVAPYPCWATSDSTTNATGDKPLEKLNGSPDGQLWIPGEADCTLRTKESYGGGWAWYKGEDDKLYSVDKLMEMYITSVGRNTNMLLGVVIDTLGLVPQADMKRLTEFGQEIKRWFGHPLAVTKGTGNQITLKLKKPTSVDRIILQEDIAKGERILEFKVLGKTAQGWVQLSEGSNIGHKHIDKFPAQTVSALQLVVSKSKAQPIVKNFSAFETLTN